MELRLDWNQRDAKFFADKGLQKALERALKKAGNTAARDMKATASRQVRFRKRYKVKDVNGAMNLIFPKGQKIDSLVWHMVVKGTAVPVYKMGARETKRGVSVAINQGRRKVIPGAFIVTLKSGHAGVFRRVGHKRLPIEELFTTRVTDVFKDNGMVPAVFERAQSSFRARFAALMPMEIDRQRKGQS